MNKQVAIFEPISLPDPRRPGTMPSLPEWLARCSGGVTQELQPTLDGRTFEDVLTLPAVMMPTPAQRQAIQEHLDSLDSYLRQTATESDEAETKIASAVTGLLLVLPSARKSELGAEARADVYLEVLDDVPWWAVKAACWRWHRRDCGKDERGEEYDYRWAPDPGTLRRVAYGETWPVKQRMRDLRRVLDAREYVDCSKQLEDGRAAMRGFNLARAKNPDAASRMTFAEAIDLGNQDTTE